VATLCYCEIETLSSAPGECDAAVSAMRRSSGLSGTCCSYDGKHEANHTICNSLSSDPYLSQERRKFKVRNTVVALNLICSSHD
jgi:hypothetical protein